MCKLARCSSRIRSEDICKHIFTKCGISTKKDRITVEGVVLEFDGRKMFPKKQSSDGKNEIPVSGGKKRARASGGKNGLHPSGKNGVAFEYNGIQHSEFVPYFHRTREKFVDLVKRDTLKKVWCEQQNVDLLIIPHTVPRDQLVHVITRWLEEKGWIETTVAQNVRDTFHWREDTSLYEKISPLTVTAYNGGNFDFLLVIFQILANDKHKSPKEGIDTSNSSSNYKLCNLLRSNNCIISFDYGPLHFIDLCQITKTSLRNAATAMGAPTAKGFFPHRYLQSLSSNQQFFERLNSSPLLSELKDYIDWFVDTPASLLQQIVAGETLIQRQQRLCPEMLAWYKENQDRPYPVRARMEEYVVADTQALLEITLILGKQMWTTWGLNISYTCTAAGLASKIWQSMLNRPILKLDANLDQVFRKANRGGFCGPLGPLEFRAPPNHCLYKVDVTSLYPSCTRPIVELQDVWQDFPCPTVNDRFQHQSYGSFISVNRGPDIIMKEGKKEKENEKEKEKEKEVEEEEEDSTENGLLKRTTGIV